METRSANAGFSVVAATGPNICRICLTNGGTGKQGQVQGLESIFSTVVDYECKSLYGILLEVCAPLGTREMLNGMPERICRGCKWRLLTAYELYETCLRSDEKMREVSAREIQLKQVGFWFWFWKKNQLLCFERWSFDLFFFFNKVNSYSSMLATIQSIQYATFKNTMSLS